MSKLSTILNAAKASPVKSVSIAAGVASVLVGGIYLTKKMRKDTNAEIVAPVAKEVMEEEAVADAAAAVVVDESIEAAANA